MGSFKDRVKSINITDLRSSSYNDYDFCQQKCFLTYILGHPSKANKKAELGTIVHKVLEGLALAKKAKQDNKSCINDNEIYQNYSLDNCNPDNLLYDSYDFYTATSEFEFTTEDYELCDTWVKMALTQHNCTFNPHNREIIEAEHKFNIVIPDEWASYNYNGKQGNLLLHGTIDLMTKVNDNTMEIIDWKTGQRKNWNTGKVKTYKCLTKDPQLLIYYYAANFLHPEYDHIIVTIYYIRDGGPYSICFDKSDLDMAKAMIRYRFLEMKNNQNPKLLSWNMLHFKCQRWCEYGPKSGDEPLCSLVRDHIKQHGIDSATERFSV